MNILVTGGAGYIGSTVARQLLDAGHSVSVFDNLSSGHRAAVPKAATFVQGDILDRAALDSVLGGAHFAAVMHFAAFIEAGESMREPGRFFRNNVTGALTLIDAAVAHDVQRFVFSSTAGVYASRMARWRRLTRSRRPASTAPPNTWSSRRWSGITRSTGCA